MTFNIRNFGAVGDGIADDLPAFLAAMAAMGPVHKGGELHVPPGVYRLSGPLELKKCMVLMGEGVGDFEYSSTVLQFDSGVDGIVVHRDGTSGHTGLADWSRVGGLTLTSLGGNGAGVRMYARAHIFAVHISGFQDGVVINTDGAGRNANGFTLRNMRITGCRGDGVFVRGSDSNAGLVEMVDVTGCAGYGFFDESLTGNTYLACHTSACGRSGYHMRNAGAGGALINCYSESGAQPASNVMEPAVVLGGTHGAGFTAESTAFRLGSRFGFTPFGANTLHPDGKVTTTFIGSALEPSAGLRLAHTDDLAGLRLGWGNGGWVMGAVNAGDALRIDKGTSQLVAPNGIALGAVAGTAPLPGVWASNGDPRRTGVNWMACRGDLVLNQLASSKVRGWVCIQNCGWGGQWLPNNGPYTRSVLVTPSVPNGFAYRLAADSPGWSTSAIEPVWPTAIGARVTEGTTIWECYGPTDQGLEPL